MIENYNRTFVRRKLLNLKHRKRLKNYLKMYKLSRVKHQLTNWVRLKWILCAKWIWFGKKKLLHFESSISCPRSQCSAVDVINFQAPLSLIKSIHAPLTMSSTTTQAPMAMFSLIICFLANWMILLLTDSYRIWWCESLIDSYTIVWRIPFDWRQFDCWIVKMLIRWWWFHERYSTMKTFDWR